MSVNRTEKAAQSIRRLRGKAYPEAQIHSDVEEIAKYIAIEREVEKSTSYLDCLRGTDLRRTHIAVGVVVWQVLSGISFVNA